MTTSASVPVDGKLLHQLKKYLDSGPVLFSSTPTPHSSSPPIDAALSFLLTTSTSKREYSRKPPTALRAAVLQALIQMKAVESKQQAENRLAADAKQANAQVSTPTDNNTPESSRAPSPSGGLSSGGLPPASATTLKKRKPSSDLSEEDEIDSEIKTQKVEAHAAAFNSNSLNSSIRNKYANSQALSISSLSTSVVPGAQGTPTGGSNSLPPTPPASQPMSSATLHPSSQAAKKKLMKNSSRQSGSSSSKSDKEDPAALCERPTTRYSDLGGVESILQTVRELIEYPLSHPEIYAHIGVEPPRGILLHGPPGCGKTLLANAMAGQLGVAFLKISAPEIVSGMSGESEQKVREIFSAAIDNAPAILFIDEVDAIMSKRDGNARGMEKRIVAQLLTCMDSLSMENTNNKPVMVIGATNRPDSLDSALRRAGRFDREICMGVPDEKARCR